MNIAVSESPHTGVVDQIKDREALERMIDALDISIRNLGRNGQSLSHTERTEIVSGHDPPSFLTGARMEIAEIKPILTADKATLIFSAQKDAILPCDLHRIRPRQICARAATAEASVPPATAP